MNTTLTILQGIGSPAPEPQGLLLWQIRGMLVTGAVLFVVEATLFGRALRARRAGRPLATPTLAGAPA